MEKNNYFNTYVSLLYSLEVFFLSEVLLDYKTTIRLALKGQGPRGQAHPAFIPDIHFVLQLSVAMLYICLLCFFKRNRAPNQATTAIFDLTLDSAGEQKSFPLNTLKSILGDLIMLLQ